MLNQDVDERRIAERSDEIQQALLEAGVNAEVFYDEDSDEGWHITIGAGHEHYRAEGGMSREFVLTYWTRDDSWYWETLSADSDHCGPWLLLAGRPDYLDGSSSVASIVGRVQANVSCNLVGCGADVTDGAEGSSA